jgi:hypothetical protein
LAAAALLFRPMEVHQPLVLQVLLGQTRSSVQLFLMVAGEVEVGHQLTTKHKGLVAVLVVVLVVGLAVLEVRE